MFLSSLLYKPAIGKDDLIVLYTRLSVSLGDKEPKTKKSKPSSKKETPVKKAKKEESEEGSESEVGEVGVDMFM